MDRCFVVDTEALKEFDSDGIVIQNILKRFAKTSCDVVVKVNNLDNISKTKLVPGRILKIVPISSVERTRKWLKDVCKVDMPPIEIPQSLRKYSPSYQILKGSSVIEKGVANSSFFIKRVDELKSWNNLLYEGNVSHFIQKDALYSITRKQKIVAEYRIFICDDRIVACQPYVFNGLAFPNVRIIKEMIRDYTTQKRPKAYTLDVMVTDKNETIPIEVHPFVACGLYGFEDKKLLDMWEKGIDWYIGSKLQH